MSRADTLRRAVLAGELATVRDELRAGGDPNLVIGEKRSRREPQRDMAADGYTALHVAAYENDVALCKLMLEFDADVHVATRFGTTALELATDWNSPGVLALLLEAGADPNLVTRTGGALVIAAGAGNHEVVALLLEVGAKRGLDAALLSSCGRKGDPRILALLLDAGAMADAPAPDQWSARVCALYFRKQACLDILRERTEPKTLLDTSIDGNVPKVRALLDAGADPNTEVAYRITSLVAAARLGHREIVGLLVETGANVNHDSVLGAPILCALESNHLEVADVLHRHGATLDGVLGLMLYQRCKSAAWTWVCERHTPEKPDALLASAAGYADIPAMRAMLAAGANPNGREAWGRSGLMLAVAANRVDAVRLLLEHGADPRGTDRHGRPLLHYVLTYDDVTDDWDDPDFDPNAYERDSPALEMEAVRLILEAGARLPWER